MLEGSRSSRSEETMPQASKRFTGQSLAHISHLASFHFPLAFTTFIAAYCVYFVALLSASDAKYERGCDHDS